MIATATGNASALTACPSACHALCIAVCACLCDYAPPSVHLCRRLRVMLHVYIAAYISMSVPASVATLLQLLAELTWPAWPWRALLWGPASCIYGCTYTSAPVSTYFCLRLRVMLYISMSAPASVTMLPHLYIYVMLYIFISDYACLCYYAFAAFARAQLGLPSLGRLCCGGQPHLSRVML